MGWRITSKRECETCGRETSHKVKIIMWEEDEDEVSVHHVAKIYRCDEDGTEHSSSIKIRQKK